MKKPDNNTHYLTEGGQVYLGEKGLIFFITMMNMFIPLSTDMYLPALPSMSSYFECSSAITNLTLSIFFIFYAAGILLWGPLSDKYGRRPILLSGSIIYMASSIACAVSSNIYFLIFARIFQGVGAGGITSVSVAVIKDSYSGKKRETVLAVCQSVSGLAPMLAPVVGAFLLKFTDWRGSFWVLAAISAVNLLLTILFKETLKGEDRYNGTLLGSLGLLAVVAKNKCFMIPAVIFSLVSLPFLGYIAVSSYIYVDYFGLSAQVYSYFFAGNAFISIVGPFIYIRFLSSINKKRFTSLSFAMSALGGILVMTAGTLSPVFFWLSFALVSFSAATIRPFSVNILLEQQKNDTGSASSIINTLFTVLGSIGMTMASMPWANIVTGLGILITIFSMLSLLSWILFLKSKVPCTGLK